MESPATTLRILCLHDGGSNAGTLKDQLSALGKQLYEKHAIDLVYVDSPLVLANGEHENHRVWWDIDELSGEKNGEDSIRYRGLDASLMLIRQVWNSAPFWGILGVGQGAAVASILIALLEDNATDSCCRTDGEINEFFAMRNNTDLSVPPHLAVFVNGETLVLTDEVISCTPSLHIINAATTQSEERLLRQHPGTVCEMNGGCNSSSMVNAIGRFVCNQKKELFQGIAGTTSLHQQEIVTLQAALHLAEQDAANSIANAIALEPPAALMAVIRPREVAGWQGEKRRPKESGGSPCPAEFLLRRTKRTVTG
jgi:Serine hydrolase (FSH1)